jgi:hypothetical protein
MTKKNEPLLPGIATQQTARDLIRLYARLKGEVQKSTDGEDTFMWANKAKVSMRHISRLMVLMGIDLRGTGAEKLLASTSCRDIGCRPSTKCLNCSLMRADVALQI